ncbi:MAG TPA: hypothetical protein VFG90_02045 [Nitrososphaeraceae archaeon]|nr:hypothetical protein [Nitrososphaeraceae archaeon]
MTDITKMRDNYNGMDYNYHSRYFIGLHDRENVKFYGFTLLTNSMPSGIPKAI